MSRRKVEGTCHLCGIYGPLSFEHVPPKAAFNDRPVVMHTIEQIMEREAGRRLPEGMISQRGAGGYTLCNRCNNKTGRWYGKRFAFWCQQGLEILIRAEGKPSLFYLHHVFPLATIKQVATMFFSVNSPNFHRKHAELQAFVLDKERRFLSPRYRFFVYFHGPGTFRVSGVAGWVDLKRNRNRILSEFTFPPFGYVMTFGDDPPHRDMFEITGFARYAYNDFATMELRMPVLPVHTPFPGDYRTAEQVAREAAENAKYEPPGD